VTVQRPASATILPTVGAAAVGPANSFIGTGSWYVTDRGATFTQGDVQKFNITIDKAYG